jgi:L-ascorbate metabolism protein UlaG (beta-lactamase superfamily)
MPAPKPQPNLPRRRFLRIAAWAAGAVMWRKSPSLMAAESAASTPFPISDHCDGHRFFNPKRPGVRGFTDLLRWKLSSTPAVWPQSVEVTPRPPAPLPAGEALGAQWINHATFLLQTTAGTVLTDPVYSERVSPVGWAGPRRVHVPGIAFNDLPRIDVVVLSHDHYDHCDLATLERLNTAHAPLAVTLLGNGSLLRSAGFTPDRIVELDWWSQHTTANGLSIQATPARHWSNRATGPRNGRLWGGFFLKAGNRTAHFAGDTGYDDEMFAAIRQRCGAPDLAMIPIGAYEPRWFMAEQHCNPEEAVKIHLELGAKRSIGMHWGTFQLTDEAREAPLTALTAALTAAKLPPASFRAIDPGETIVV